MPEMTPPCQLTACDLLYAIRFLVNHSETTLSATFQTLEMNVNIQNPFYS